MTAKLNKLTPNLMVEDVNQTIQFYRDVLAFEVLATVPEEGTFAWAMLKRDNVEIMFQQRVSLTEEIPTLPTSGSPDCRGRKRAEIPIIAKLFDSQPIRSSLGNRL